MNRVADPNCRAHLVPVVDAEREPTPAELDAIEAEWPLIAAETAIVDAECARVLSPGCELAARRYRRAVNQHLVVMRRHVTGGHCPPEVA